MRNRLYLFVVFIVAVAADQITKMMVDARFGLFEIRPLIGDVLRLQYIRNPGAAFGITYGGQAVMLTITAVITVILIYLFLSGKLDPGTSIGRVSAVLVISGAVGNLIDRIRYGEVIDFIDMGIGNLRWPKYNFADIYLTIGIIILLTHYLFLAQDDEKNQNFIADIDTDENVDG